VPPETSPCGCCLTGHQPPRVWCWIWRSLEIDFKNGNKQRGLVKTVKVELYIKETGNSN